MEKLVKIQILVLEQYSVIMTVTKNEINISNDTFVGSNVSLVAPLKIGESSYWCRINNNR